jgi:hypothetical protein
MPPRQRVVAVAREFALDAIEQAEYASLDAIYARAIAAELRV